MTTRRDALLTSPLFCAVPRSHAQAPKAGPPKRLGILFPGPDNQGPRPQRPFYIALREKGWILGENLIAEPAYADGRYERLEGLAEQLVKKRVDVILTDGDPATVIAARATRTIPIMFINVGFPLERGLIDSYARPGRNVTGLSLYAGLEVAQRRLALLKEIAPKAIRLAWLVTGEALPASVATVSGAKLDLSSTVSALAGAVGFETRFFTLRMQDLDAAFGEVSVWRTQAVTAGQGLVFLDSRQRLAELLLRQRLPSAFLYRQNTESGGLLSYGVGRSEAAYAQQRLVEYVDQLLRGKPPGELPVERPNRYELVLNMKTANALGLVIPQSLLLRADEVIQ